MQTTHGLTGVENTLEIRVRAFCWAILSMKGTDAFWVAAGTLNMPAVTN